MTTHTCTPGWDPIESLDDCDGNVPALGQRAYVAVSHLVRYAGTEIERTVGFGQTGKVVDWVAPFHQVLVELDDDDVLPDGAVWIDPVDLVWSER